jgi:NAD(P)-dependent dehydrogenase (short-subunit alcohol dehydrogenase family)
VRTFALKDIPISDAQFPDLKGKTAIITGGERGIGQGIAAFLGRQGMNIAILGISSEEGEYAVRQFLANDIPALWRETDVSQAADVEQALEQVTLHFGGLDLLVNNAALNKIIDFLDYDEETYLRTFEKNTRMVYNMSLQCAKYMAEQQRGGIINISSVGGLRAHRQSVGYNATKGAVDSMTRAMALDLAPKGIRVNAVAPGAIINRPISERMQPVRDKQAEGIPLGRVGSVTDVAALVGFLASDVSAYVTGQVIYVDGGLSTQLTPPGIYI